MNVYNFAETIYMKTVPLLLKGDKMIPRGNYKPSFSSRAKYTYFSKEFFIFIFCGGCGTLVNLGISLLLSSFIDPTLAYVGGYATSLFVTFLMTSFLVFKIRLSLSRFVKFVISYIPNFLILFVFVALLINILHIWKVAVYLSAALLCLPLNFIIVKQLAFKKSTY